eukprot:scaffold19_cov114-Cylindrotheca_fusiformis.AAC.9
MPIISSCRMESGKNLAANWDGTLAVGNNVAGKGDEGKEKPIWDEHKCLAQGEADQGLPGLRKYTNEG